jgi:hypothetical protein
MQLKETHGFKGGCLILKILKNPKGRVGNLTSAGLFPVSDNRPKLEGKMKP